MHLFGRGLPNADIKMICSLFLCISLQFYNSPPTFSSRFDELRGDFCFSKTPPKIPFPFQTSEGTFNFLFKIPPIFSLPGSNKWGDKFSQRNIWKIGQFGCAFLHPLSKWVKGVFSMARLSKKLKQEWDFFISPKTGRRTYNDLCRKCRNDCKQSFRAIVVCCPMYCSKRSVKSVPNSNDFNDSG